MVEASGQIAGDLDVLHLVFADGHQVGVVEQNVGRHQHGIGEQPGVGRQPFGLLILVGVTSFEQAHRRDGHQQPAQFRDFGHVGLHEQRRRGRDRAPGPAGQWPRRGCIARALPIADGRQRVQVGDEVEGRIGSPCKSMYWRIAPK